MAHRKDPLRRRHHTVSKFYLAGFANESRQLSQVHLPGHHTHLNSVVNATVDTDFYSVRAEDGSLDDTMERAFGELEGPAAGVLQRGVDSLWPLPSEEKATLASWIALQYMRGPALRRTQNQLMAQMHQMIVLMAGRPALRQAIEAHEGRAISDARLEWEWNDLTQGGGPTLEPDAFFHARTIGETLPWLTDLVFQSQWMLVTFQRRNLFTCDHPVSLVAPSDLPSFLGVGLATAEAYLLPLSRKLGLVVMPHEHGADVQVGGTTNLWRVFVDHTLENARGYLFHHPEDSIPPELILPQPRSLELAQLDTSIFERRISVEEIVDTSADRAARKRMRDLTSTEPTLSGADLVWPIPGRIALERPDSL
ncbi:MAG: DUF4238 domain-containing protein [Candidatus Nanopelagicales bacterium]|nr:DUF4238 domain-containing protein [Candidatus Nanopelagicales bacterium]